MCPAAHGMRGQEGDARGRRIEGAFLHGPGPTQMGAGLPRLFPGESFHVASDEPMMASMAGRYAAALFELARDQRQLDGVERDLATLARMLEASPDLRRLVRSPVLTTDDQAKGLNALLAKAGIAGP